MSLPVVFNGYYFDVSGSGMVVVTGPGLPTSGLQLSYVDTLTIASFTQAVDSASLSPAARAALLSDAESAASIRSSIVAAMQTPAKIPVGSDPAVTAHTTATIAAAAATIPIKTAPVPVTGAALPSIAIAAAVVPALIKLLPNVPIGATATPIIGSPIFDPAGNPVVSIAPGPLSTNIEQIAATTNVFDDKKIITINEPITQLSATTNVFDDKKLVPVTEPVAQVAATTNIFDDKKLPVEPLTQIQATTNVFDDKKLPDEPVAQVQVTTNIFDDKKLPEEPPLAQVEASTNISDDKRVLPTGSDPIDPTTYPDVTGGSYGVTTVEIPNTQLGLTTSNQMALDSSVAISKQLPDWRAKLSLAPSANYLYNAPNPGILAPLSSNGGTDGVIFPYTPMIQVQYAAHYDPTALTHSNYKIFQYGSSSVDSVQITCDFTAQDTAEANYLLAVIHFFRTITKMFYGQDGLNSSPAAGTPPPLCYLTGFGAFQFDEHPMAITAFNYTLPIDVDYVRARSPTSAAGANTSAATGGNQSAITDASAIRIANANLHPGAVTALPNWAMYPEDNDPTYVPTKMQINISAVPIVTRNDISNDFSVQKYATGALLQGSRRSGRGGIW